VFLFNKEPQLFLIAQRRRDISSYDLSHSEETTFLLLLRYFLNTTNFQMGHSIISA